MLTLLDQLYGTGIRGTAHKWLKSYLENRRQYVDIEATSFNTGKTVNIKSEDFISQVNVLGYILFLTYANDLPTQLDDQCTIFAEDVSVIVPCSYNY